MNLTALVYRALLMARHPDAIRLYRKGICWEDYRELRRPWLLNRRFRTIVDVGANVGQFARLAREVWPAATIHSIEPLPDCFDALRNALPGDANFNAVQAAVGHVEGEFEFFRSPHSPSSSFLPMTELHREAFPETQDGQEKEPVRVTATTLDTLAQRLNWEPPVLLKVDVQGYEGRVIDGGRRALRQIDVVLMETSFVPLYEGQPLFPHVLAEMSACGFSYQGSLHQMLHSSDERVVQADSIFVRTGSSR